MQKTLKKICELQPFYAPENTVEMKERGQLIRKELSSEINSIKELLSSKLGPYGTDFDISSSDGIGKKLKHRGYASFPNACPPSLPMVINASYISNVMVPAVT